MSWQHIKAVWAKSQSKGAARLVMLCIADHVNEQDEAWPSVSTIARETQVSERQVKRAVDDLVTTGELAILRRGNGRGYSTVYSFLLSQKGVTVTPNEPPVKGDIPAEKGDIGAERVTLTTRKGDTMTPEVLREKPKEKKKKERIEGVDTPSREKPYDVYLKLVEIQRGINQGQTLKDCKQLLEAGFTQEDIVSCGRFILSDPYFKGKLIPLNTQMILTRIDAWKQQGRPPVWVEPSINGRNGHGPAPAPRGLAAVEQFKAKHGLTRSEQ